MSSQEMASVPVEQNRRRHLVGSSLEVLLSKQVPDQNTGFVDFNSHSSLYLPKPPKINKFGAFAGRSQEKSFRDKQY